MKPARFWPLAAIILLPVLVLAGVAAYRLRDYWEQVEAKARAEGVKHARRVAESWEAYLPRLKGAVVYLYPQIPEPHQQGADALALEAAVSGNDIATLRRLREKSGSGEFTASGLPVRLLAAWHLWKQTGSRDDLDVLANLALHRNACVLSPVILKWVDSEIGRKTGKYYLWMSEWDDLEARRQLAAQLPAGSQRGIIPDGPGKCAWVERMAEDGTVKVLRWYDIAQGWEALDHSVETTGPAWAALVLHAGDASFSSPKRIQNHPEYASAQAGPFFRIAVHYWDDTVFRFEYNNLKVWTVSLLLTALSSTAVGLWLIKRTLNKERRLGELKSQFVSSVSHELRAPIGSMRLMAEGLATGRVKGEAAGEFHRLMAGEGARLSALIENVLDFARIEQGRKEYVMAETDVAALLADAVALMQPQAEAKGLRILLECEPLPFVPKVDAGALQQAVVNLLDNAVKFTPGRPAWEGADKLDASGLKTIRVRLAAEADGWSITVTDPGIGIPREEHARIFERFYRLGNELRRETTGTGIGLAIVKHIVEGHGGKVTVCSETGRGSVFSMMFPAEK